MSEIFKSRIERILEEFKKLPAVETNDDSINAFTALVVPMVVAGFSFRMTRYPVGNRFMIHFEKSGLVHSIVSRDLETGLVLACEKALGLTTMPTPKNFVELQHLTPPIIKRPTPQVSAKAPAPVEPTVAKVKVKKGKKS